MSVFFLKFFAVLFRQVIACHLGKPVPRGVVSFEVVRLSVSGTRPYVLCIEYEEIFVFEDLMLAPNVASLRCLVNDCLRNLEQD